MSGNSFGKMFSVTSFGESHGIALGGVIDGCPPNLLLSEEDIQEELNRRKPGTSRHVSPRQESDRIEILSGVFEGKTTGTPIGFIIKNEDQRSHDYSKIADVFRPGHADYTYQQKYGHRDYRGGGRASARETVVRVAAGAIAKKWLKERFGVTIFGHLAQLGCVEIPFVDQAEAANNPFFAPNKSIVEKLEETVDALRKEGDSTGALVRVFAQNVPIGWGEPVYSRLDADIACAMMSINAVKGVEIGDGFLSVAQKGSEHGDEMRGDEMRSDEMRSDEMRSDKMAINKHTNAAQFLSNHSGGILGGISSGQDIRVSIAVKPTPSIRTARHTINVSGENVTSGTQGRHDPCVGIRAVPVAEAMLAIVLMDHALRHRAQCADVRL